MFDRFVSSSVRSMPCSSSFLVGHFDFEGKRHGFAVAFSGTTGRCLDPFGWARVDGIVIDAGKLSFRKAYDSYEGDIMYTGRLSATGSFVGTFDNGGTTGAFVATLNRRPRSPSALPLAAWYRQGGSRGSASFTEASIASDGTFHARGSDNVASFTMSGSVTPSALELQKQYPTHTIFVWCSSRDGVIYDGWWAFDGTPSPDAEHLRRGEFGLILPSPLHLLRLRAEEAEVRA